MTTSSLLLVKQSLRPLLLIKLVLDKAALWLLTTILSILRFKLEPKLLISKLILIIKFKQLKTLSKKRKVYLKI